LLHSLVVLVYYYQRVKLKANVREVRGKISESVSQSGLRGIFVDVKLILDLVVVECGMDPLSFCCCIWVAFCGLLAEIFIFHDV
jgi:hypothetical protein